MKRYNVNYGEDSHGPYVLEEESFCGRYVDADTAQLLYDTLVTVRNEMEHNPVLEEEIEQALVRADLGYNY